MHLLWAWYGAGKTHTLRYLEHKCRTEYPHITPVYVEMPRTLGGFGDVYRALLSRMNLGQICDGFLERFSGAGTASFCGQLMLDCPDLLTAMKSIAYGRESEALLATQWLRNECEDKKALKGLGIAAPLKTADKTVKVLSWLLDFIRQADPLGLDVQRKRTFLFMLDEFQTVGKCRPTVRDEINSALLLLFNSNPEGLAVVISYAGQPEQKGYPEWLSPDLKDRMGISRVLSLPPLREDEARVFIADVIAHFRSPDGPECGRYFPFTQEAVNVVLTKMKHKQADFKPRSLMQFFEAVLLEVAPAIQRGEAQSITPSHVEAVLKDRVFDTGLE